MIVVEMMAALATPLQFLLAAGSAMTLIFIVLDSREKRQNQMNGVGPTRHDLATPDAAGRAAPDHQHQEPLHVG
jgi:hypothetical protein